MKKILIHIICILVSYCSLAQDTSYALATAIIIDSFDQSYTEYNQVFTKDPTLQTIYSGGPLSETLQFAASGISRSSGPGKLTTFTKHGLPTEHTLVSWNKLELNSSLNGIVDFSTLPTFLISNQSSLGEQFTRDVKLSSHSRLGTDILVQLGAFNQLNGGIKHGTAVGKSVINIGSEFVKSKNNIRYTNDLNEEQEQHNGEYEQLHGVLDFAHRFNEHSGIQINTMYSDISTNIPPTIFQKTSDAHQENGALKLAANYYHQKKNHILEINYGCIREKLQYINPSLNLDATHIFHRNSVEIDWKCFTASESIIGLRIKETLEGGRSDNFSVNKSSVNTAAEINYSSAWREQFILSLSVGIQHARSIWSPLIYNINTTYILNSKNRFRLSIESLFRLPTFNERYWEPGGNLLLEAERGQAAVFDYFYASKTIHLELGASMHRLKDRILWQPQSTGFFSPINIGKIGSEEFYGGIRLKKTIGQLNLSASLRYTFLHAHIIASPTMNIIGNAVPFTPAHSLNQFLHVTWNKHWSTKLMGSYQSKSYISTDNNRFLNDFYLLNSEIRYTFYKASVLASTFIKINNITNTSYFLTSGYPQAERHWQFGLILRIKPKTQ